MSTVKLEVGAWYGVLIRDRVEFGQRVDKDRYYFPDCAEIQNFKDSMVSGPYQIEPGDRVKPKPAGDKCWEAKVDELGGVSYGRGAEGEFVVKEIRRANTSKAFTSDHPDKPEGIYLSCLILLEKAAKALARDFQVGDEVEYASHCSLAGQRRVVVGFGERGFILLGRMNGGGDCGMAEKYHLKLIRRAGENEEGQKCPQCKDDTESKPHYCPKCGQEFYRGKDDPLICVDCFNRGQTKGKLNPATLPSLLGGEQTWPDVKPGALLDTLPMNMHTTEDELVARDSDYQVCRMGDALGCIENIELGIVNNSDRERIRKIIPEIERKLTQLKGRL